MVHFIPVRQNVEYMMCSFSLERLATCDQFWSLLDYELVVKILFFKDALSSYELGLYFLPSLVPSEFLKKDNKTKRQKEKKANRKKTKRKKEKKTERQKDKKTKRQRGKKTRKQKDKNRKRQKIQNYCFWCNISWILQPWDLGFWASHNLWIWDIATNSQLWDFGLIHSINKINKGIPINS